MRARRPLLDRSASRAAVVAISSGAAALGVVAIGDRAPVPRAGASGLESTAEGATPPRSPPPSSPSPPLSSSPRAGVAPPWAPSLAAGRQTLLQRGGPDADLFLWVHIGGDLLRKPVADLTTDAVITEFWGLGSNAYRPLIPGYGGFSGWVDAVAHRAGRSGFRHTCLTTWSAGSQVIKDVCKGADWPDAIVSLDGLYGQKPPGSRQGDGQVVWDEGLEAVARCAASAARRERIMVLLHSSIRTPFASSGEVAAALQRRVEEQLGTPMRVDSRLTPEDLDGHAFEQALELGDLHIVAFAGDNAREHITQAHLFDEVWLRWVPWVRDDAPTPDSPTAAAAPAAPVAAPAVAPPTTPSGRDLNPR